jgi:hypothetical protein
MRYILVALMICFLFNYFVVKNYDIYSFDCDESNTNNCAPVSSTLREICINIFLARILEVPGLSRFELDDIFYRFKCDGSNSEKFMFALVHSWKLNFINYYHYFFQSYSSFKVSFSRARRSHSGYLLVEGNESRHRSYAPLSWRRL